MVEGVDAREPLGQALVAVLKAALLRHKVLFFREQNLSRDQHVNFVMHFGDVFLNPSGASDYDDGGMARVTVVPFFHADIMYMPNSPSFSMLQMLELPSVGGDTMWLDLVTGYAALSEPFRKFLEGLMVMQSYLARDAMSDDELRNVFSRSGNRRLPTTEELDALRESLRPWECPLVRVIPETGVRNYWVADSTPRSLGPNR